MSKLRSAVGEAMLQSQAQHQLRRSGLRTPTRIESQLVLGNRPSSFAIYMVVIFLIFKFKSMKKVFCGVIISILISAGCVKWGEGAYTIRIQNNDNDTIQFYGSYVYPDTTIANQRPGLIMAYPSTYSYWSSKEKWESVLPSDTISIYILSKDTVDKYSWELIKSGNRIMKRYDLSIGDLKKLGWEITFPPTEAMKNIKQFPPY